VPITSILIPVYNRETLVRRAIESAQAQTVQDIEIVVVDNASTDGTFDVVAAMAETDRRIKLLRNATNIGPVRNWQACAAQATAPYSKIVFSDDAIAPTYLERTLPALLAAERERIEARIPRGVRIVALDERGTALTTQALAAKLKHWQLEADDVALVIGGPDGLDPEFKRLAHERIRLSDLTLPHAFVRFLLAEALYRAWSLTTGHPYHRE